LHEAELRHLWERFKAHTGLTARIFAQLERDHLCIHQYFAGVFEVDRNAVSEG